MQRKRFETVYQWSGCNAGKNAPDDAAVGDYGYRAFLSPFCNGRPATMHPVMEVGIALSSGNAYVYKVRHPGLDLFLWQFVPVSHFPITAKDFHQVVLQRK